MRFPAAKRAVAGRRGGRVTRRRRWRPERQRDPGWTLGLAPVWMPLLPGSPEAICILFGNRFQVRQSFRKRGPLQGGSKRVAGYTVSGSHVFFSPVANMNLLGSQ